MLEKRNGFSLLELIIVIALIALVAGIVAPILTGTVSGNKLDADIKELGFNIRLAQQYALGQKDGYRFYGIKFLTQGYKVVRFEPQGLTPPIRQSSPSSVVFVPDGRKEDGLVSLNPGVKYHKKPKSLIFNPRGSATSDGEQLLSGQQTKITLSCGTFKKSLTIIPAAGYVKFE